MDFDTLISDANNTDYSSCVADILSSSAQPISIDEVVSSVQHLRPLGHDARATVRQTLENLFQAVEVAPDTFGWLTNLIDGTVIRHPLTSEEARQGFLLLDELEHAVLFPEFFQTHRSSERILYIELFGGAIIPAEAYIERKTWSLRLGPQFIEWLDEHGGQGRDDIIIMVDNAAEGRYTVRLHPREARDNSMIQSRNVQLTLRAEEIVRDEQNLKGSMTTWDLAAKLLTEEVYRDSCPPDDLHCVLHQYSLLHFDSSVGYTLKDEGTGNINDSKNQKAYSNTNKAPNVPDVKYDVPAKSSLLSSTSPEGHTSTTVDADYDRYLDKLFQSGIMDSPFTEQEYHVLRAELDSLNSLEKQFGYLLTEQRNRQHDLLSCLLIEPGTVADDDIDMSSRSDFDEPPCWEN